MINQDQLIERAYKSGKCEGFNSIAKAGTMQNGNPYIDDLLRETWAAGFYDGMQEAVDELTEVET
jgi:hypothetical protein